MDKRISALAFALENEEREREFYLAQAKKTKNMAGKNMFKQIAMKKKNIMRSQKLHDGLFRKSGSAPSLKVKITTGTILQAKWQNPPGSAARKTSCRRHRHRFKHAAWPCT